MLNTRPTPVDKRNNIIRQQLLEETWEDLAMNGRLSQHNGFIIRVSDNELRLSNQGD